MAWLSPAKFFSCCLIKRGSSSRLRASVTDPVQGGLEYIFITALITEKREKKEKETLWICKNILTKLTKAKENKTTGIRQEKQGKKLTKHFHMFY